MACVYLPQIVGWGGLGVHYDKETEMDTSLLQSAQQPEVTRIGLTRIGFTRVGLTRTG